MQLQSDLYLQSKWPTNETNKIINYFINNQIIKKTITSALGSWYSTKMENVQN